MIAKYGQQIMEKNAMAICHEYRHWWKVFIIFLSCLSLIQMWRKWH